MASRLPAWVGGSPTPRASLLVVVLMVVSLGLCASASANPLIIQSGYFGFSGGDPAAFRFIGQDFLLGAVLFRGFPSFGPLALCPYSVGCGPGTALDFSASYAGPVIGWQTFAAPAQFPLPNDTSVLYSVDFTVNGPTMAMPTATEGLMSVTAPFTFSGTLTANAITGSYLGSYSGPPTWELGPVLFSTTLSGQGTAELRLDTWRCSPTADCTVSAPYLPGAVIYTFTPTDAVIPEPGTLALLLGGAGALAGSFRRRRRSH